MFMVSDNLKIALLTEHIPINEVTGMITPSLIKKRVNIVQDSLVNDFKVGKLTMFDISHNSDAVEYTSVVNPIPESFTGDFALDSQDNVWYTSWRPDDVGVLAKVNISMYTEELDQDETLSENDVEAFEFPQDLNTANGLSVDSNGDIWIVDTSSSFFFKFEPTTEEFTKYITHVPHLSTYGNETGAVSYTHLTLPTKA